MVFSRNLDKDFRWVVAQRKKSFASREECLRRTRWETKGMTISMEAREMFESWLDARFPKHVSPRQPLDILSDGTLIFD